MQKQGTAGLEQKGQVPEKIRGAGRGGARTLLNILRNIHIFGCCRCRATRHGQPILNQVLIECGKWCAETTLMKSVGLKESAESTLIFGSFSRQLYSESSAILG
jgi:hypothetical protein